MKKLLKNKKGASLVEYALLVALIAVVAIGAISILGRNIESKFVQVGDCINNPNSPNCS